MRPGRDAFVVLLLFLMELLASYPLLVGTGMLQATSAGYGSIWLLLAAGLAGCITALGLTESSWDDTTQRLIIVTVGACSAGGLSALTVTNRAHTLATAALLVLAYWRGLVAGQETAAHERVRERLGLGFVLLLLGLIVVVARGSAFRRPVWSEMALAGIAYTAIALTTLAVARIAPNRLPGTGTAVSLATGLPVAGLMVVGLFALEIFSLDVGGWLAHLLTPVADAAGAVLGALLAILFAPLAGLIDLIHHHQHGPPPRITRPVLPPELRRQQHRAAPAPSWLIAARNIAAVLLAVAIAAVFWRALPRVTARRTRTSGDRERTQVTREPFWQALRAWLRALFRGGAGTVAAQMEHVRRRVTGPQYPHDPVRRAYAQLLHRAHTQGLDRPTGTTPSQFQQQLSAHWPEGTADFALITEAYIRRRYGEALSEPAEVASLGRALSRLQHLMHTGEAAGA